MTLEVSKAIADSHMRHSTFLRSGTRTAADFDVDIGFTPQFVSVYNLTDGVKATWNAILGDDKQLVEAADGTKSYEAAGLSVKDRKLSVVVATKGLETDDDEVLIEAWG